MIPYPQLRIANLLLAPLFSAYLSQIIAHHRTETNDAGEFHIHIRHAVAA